MTKDEALKGAIGAEYQKSPWDEKGISMPPPAAQRPWVGLTEDEKETLSYKADGNTWAAVELAEAKLKEKNT
jgi:hypothetical protein